MLATRLKRTFQSRHPDLVRLMRLAQYELQNAKASAIGRWSPRSILLRRQLRHSRGLKLHIASGGSVKPGWINIDASPGADIRIDLRKRLPFQNGSAALIFCEHFCDHIAYPAGIRRFLSECSRVLEPGGRARFVLHDAADLMRAYVEGDRHYFATSEEPEETMIEVVNKYFRYNGFHQFLYDFEMFGRLLRECSFRDVIRCKYRESANPEIVLDFEHPSREITSMYIEAVR